MTGLTAGQYYQVAGIYGCSNAAMVAAAMYLWMSRARALPRFRPAVTLSAAFCLIAALTYGWLGWTWTHSSTLDGGHATEFNGLHDGRWRYADWLLTVPLQLVAFTLVLSTPARRTRTRAALLALAAIEMVLMGYIGEAFSTGDARWLWFAMGLVPFVLIIGHLYRGMGRDIAAEPAGPRRLLSNARLVLLLCWPVYAAIFALQTLGYTGSSVFTATQAAYSAADVGAKIVFAAMLCRAAVLKSAPARSMSRARAGALQQQA